MKRTTMDGNAAASYVSYAFSSLALIYPITPASPMAEAADEWSSAGKENLFGQVPNVVQMQSEAGAAGALHGALTCGALATTYTASQGLLLMIPDMYKIAGELLPTVIHVSARAVAAHALNIFGDHQDVMACRQTGFAMLAASSVQETADMALISHLATLRAEVPFLHFFDGFRTSHELNTIEIPEYEEMRTLICEEDIKRFQARALDPAKPIQRGTAQNGDTYFQNRERATPYYAAVPDIVQETMNAVAQITGRQYHPFDYFGDKNAERVVVMMGSGVGAMEETVEKMNAAGEKVGLIKVRLYRPFDGARFIAALPQTCKKIAVLDRTKEAGSLGEPLYLDVCAALSEWGATGVRVIGGRYGLGSKDFTPAICHAVFKNLALDEPKKRFTVGINDDVSHSSLTVDPSFHVNHNGVRACKFYGLGSDGTVGANKNSIKIIGNHTDLFVQAYFYYDSRKSGGITVSHLRFGDAPIRSTYLIEHAHFTACHNPSYLTRYDMLSSAMDGGVFLLNCPWETLADLEEHLPATVKRQIAQKRLEFYVIDGTGIANKAGLNGRNSTVMQAAFFLLNEQIMPYEQSIALLKEQLRTTFAKKGDEVVNMNLAAVDAAKAAVKKIEYPESWQTATNGAQLIKGADDEYFQSFIKPILSMQGDSLPVSAFNPDGTVPTGTTRFEKHGAPYLLPVWIKENCIQCNQCSFVCPHASIRPFVCDENTATPEAFKTITATGIKGAKFRVQVSPHDCMGCGVCAQTCPAKEKALVMRPATESMPTEGANWEYAQSLPAYKTPFPRESVKGSQFYQPLFEFSYACSGCGETPYVKLLTQLFGENMLIANATGCSSIYGGSSPTCPYTKNRDGHGPAWANSLFEDNAEFGLGMRLAWNANGDTENKKSVWIIGGDGWAYDIGFGGLDHVLSTGANVNVLVLDSQVYSNTGGQASKATARSAVARFATAGKRRAKKDLGLMMTTYQNVYIAQVAMGANKQQLIRALTEAQAYNGPSLILAYSPCISHGVPMQQSMEEEKRAVECGYWPLYRYNPVKRESGENPFTLDSKEPNGQFREFLMGENRFRALKKAQPDDADALFAQAEQDCLERFALYKKLSEF